MGAYEFMHGEVPIHIYADGNMSIQEAIDAAPNDKYFIIVHEGIYYQDLDFKGKSIVVKSTNPDDPNVVANTIIDGGGLANVVYFHSCEGNETLLSGFTLRNGCAYYGAGIFCYNSSPAISNCIITGNTAIYYGGGIECYYNASPIITNSIITGNYAEYYGGGMECLNNSSPTITNCIFSNNSTAGYGYGGGIDFYYNCAPVITNCTISENSSDYGGGIYSYSSSATFINCVLWNNTPQEIYSDTILTINYSDIQGGYTGTGNINDDPLFVDPTTMDYHLQQYSPCINSGTNDGAPSTDLDGNPRPSGKSCDMGAYEYY